MKRLPTFLVLFIIGLLSTGLVAGVAPAMDMEGSNRVKISLGASEWKFLKKDDYPQAREPAYDDALWETVGIPHCFNDSDTYVNIKQGHKGPFMGTVWYRKHFTLPEQYRGRKVFIEFEGVNIGAAVYINGKFIPGNSKVASQEATHVHGFIGFAVDITEAAEFGSKENVLAVRVSNGNDAWYRYPNFGQFFPFSMGMGGIFRPVNLVVTDRAYIPLNVYSVMQKWGTHVTTLSANENSAQIRVKTNVENEYPADKTIELTTTIRDAEGKSVLVLTDSAPVGSMKEHAFSQTGAISKPQLWYPAWSPNGKPYLYRVHSTLKIEGKVVDTFESPLGIRTITWDEHYPSINGKAHQLWGFGQRYEYPALGSAVPEEQQWRDIKLMTDCGGRFVRPGHCASSPETVAACDAYGVMMAQPSGDTEGALQGLTPNDPDWVLKEELHRDLLIRDRNNPSILMWEVDNGGTSPGMLTRMVGITKELEDAHPRRNSAREDHFKYEGDMVPDGMVMGFVNGLIPRAPDSPLFRRYEIADSNLDKLPKILVDGRARDGSLEKFIWDSLPEEIRGTLGGDGADKRDALISGLNTIVQGPSLAASDFFKAPADPGTTKDPRAKNVHDELFFNKLRALTDPLRAKGNRTPDENQFLNKWLLADALTTIQPSFRLMLTSFRGPAWDAESWVTRGARHTWSKEVAYSEAFANEWRNVKELGKAFAFAQWYLAETQGEDCSTVLGVDDPAVRKELEAGLRQNGKLIGRSLGCSAMDGNRIPKLIYHIWKNALWISYEQQPGVALQSHWNLSGQVNVDAWSNCPSVELFVNGVSKGMRQPEPATGHCQWADIPWEAGVLRAQGRDAAGKPVCSDQRETSGKPDRIILTTEPGLRRPDGFQYRITANGSDAGFVLATIVDEKGRWCPLADNDLTFSVSGPGVYRGSYNFWVTPGKPLDYHAPGDPELKAEGGLMKVAVRSTFQPGVVSVAVSSPGLKPGNASFETVPASKVDESVSSATGAATAKAAH